MIVERQGVTFEVADDPFWKWAGWEITTYRWLKALLSQDVDFVDVGAWIGPFTLFASRLAGRVLAIEPDPVAFQQLLQNLSLNDPRTVTTHYGGVWSHTDANPLYMMDGTWATSKSTMCANPHGDRAHVIVPVEPLQSLVERFTRRPVVIKMDTEGAEGPILEAALPWIEAKLPSLIIAPHERLYPHPDFPPVLRALRSLYPTAINQSGEPLVWPDEGAPEPSIMLFTTEDIDA